MNKERNFMSVNTVTSAGDTRMEVALADDCSEVRGFGKPISEQVAREMTNAFYRDCKKAFEIIKILQDERTYTRAENDENFEALKRLLAPETQVVSGVFGKEILLQMLAQRDCEGLRYALATDHFGRNTVVLFGVRQVQQEDGTDQITQRRRPDGRTYEVAQSEPLSQNSKGRPIVVTSDPINGEVHENSITRLDAEGFKDRLADSINEVLFGLY